MPVVLTLGPITAEMILRMAALTRDYNPVGMVPDAAREAGHRKNVLHHAWISGLVATGLRQMASGLEVAELELQYALPAYQGDILRLTIRPEESKSKGISAGVVFDVVERSGRMVATGTARLERNLEAGK
jgi:acyl dehydratase